MGQPADTGGPTAGDQADDDADGDSGPLRVVGLLRLAVVTSIVLFAVAGVVYLIYLGDKGEPITAGLALLAGVLALVLALLIYWRQSGVIGVELTPTWRRALKVGALVFCALCLAAGAGILALAFRETQIPVTTALVIEGPDVLTDNSTTTIVVPDPRRRSAIALTPRLRSVNPVVGNCEDTALLDLTAQIDGVSRATASNQRQGREARMSLKGAVDSARIRVVVRFPRDPTCQVALTIEDAFLFTG